MRYHDMRSRRHDSVSDGAGEGEEQMVQKKDRPASKTRWAYDYRIVPPASVSARGCRYPFMRPARCAATSMAPRPTGSTSALSAPTAVRIATGCPTARNTAVEITMNAMMSGDPRPLSAGWRVRTNDTEVYAEPTTEVIAAAHITAPKSR